MENLYKAYDAKEPSYLLADNEFTDAIAVSVEPGNGVIPAGAVLYRKSSSDLYAPAQAASLIAANDLAVLAKEVDTTESATRAVAAKVYVNAHLIEGYVLVYDGSSEYAPVTQAQAAVLRGQNLELRPMYDRSAPSPTESDNTATVSVTVTNDGHGTGSASPATGTYGTEVTLTATPASNYEFDEWEVVSGDVEIVGDKFTIGDKAVTIKAHFKATT